VSIKICAGIVHRWEGKKRRGCVRRGGRRVGRITNLGKGREGGWGKNSSLYRFWGGGEGGKKVGGDGGGDKHFQRKQTTPQGVRREPLVKKPFRGKVVVQSAAGESQTRANIMQGLTAVAFRRWDTIRRGTDI